MNEQLVGYLFDDKPHILAASISQWIDLSPRFKAFATTYRDKIRKKIRVTQSDTAIKDLEVELETAYWLLQEPRFTVVYEPYSSQKTRGPDFAVRFKSITFNVEVTRIAFRDGQRPLPAAEGPSAEGHTHATPMLDPLQVGGRLTDTVCDKLGQMRPGMVNILIVNMDNDLARHLDVNQAMARLKDRAERREAGLFTRYGFLNTADFFKYFLRLSGVLVRDASAGRAAEEDEAAGSLLWINNQAKHAIPRALHTILQRS
jgi:hypothetical protein